MTDANYLPQSLEAEEAAVGAMLMSKRAMDHAIAELLPDDFLRPSLRVVFTTIRDMRNAGDEVDERTVSMALRHANQLREAGGVSAVMTLAERVPAVANFKAYVREVKDVALLRDLFRAGQAVEQAAMEANPTAARQDRDAPHPVRVALDEATATLTRLRDRVDGRTFARRSDIGALVDDWGIRYQREAADPDSALAIPFPPHLPQLNHWTMGQRPGRLITSSGFTGHGKSWFGLDCTETVMRHGGRVAYFALELPADEILERLIGMGGISYAAIQNREADWDAMSDRINDLGNAGDLLTVFDGSTDLRRIESEIVGAALKGNPYRYVVIDTINLVELPGRAFERRGELDKFLLRLKNLAIDHQLTVHAQAQLNRDKNRNALDPPTLADLKESSGIEQTSDLVLFVHRLPGIQTDTLGDMGKLVVAKGRNIRRRGPIDVTFDPNGLRFIEGHSFMAGMGSVA